jgi:hypothetical protein
MSVHSSLIVHAGGIRRTRDELATLHTPSPTATWRPVPHADLVAELIGGLSARGVHVVRESYCTMGRDDARLLGTMDLQIPDLDTADFGMGLGLRGANDKSLSIQVVAAARVFVCDNWAFSGSAGAVFLKKKHTSRLDLSAVVPPAIEQFLERAGMFRLDLDRMRDTALTDNRAKELIHDGFAGPSPAAPLRLFPAVSRLYFEDDEQREKFPDRSIWSLNNAFTEAVKLLKQGPQHDAGLRIGRMFGRVLHRARATEPVVIDGIELLN